MFGLDLDAEVESIASEGTIDPSRLAAILPALDSANQRGRFYSAVTLHLASGVVPDSTLNRMPRESLGNRGLRSCLD
jgi:hypothetical protein